MRIGIDAKCLAGNLTGIGNYCANLLRELVRLRPADEFYLFANKDFNLDIPGVTKVVSEGGVFRSGVLWLMTQCPSLLRRYNIDVFWATGGLLPLNLKRVGAVLTIYDFVWRYYPATMPFLYRHALSLFTGSSLRQADRVITISHSIDREMRSFYGRGSDQIIRPAVNSLYHKRSGQELSAVRAKYTLAESYNLLVGTLEPRKNFDVFLRAYEDLAGSAAVSTFPQLAIIGGKGWRNAVLLKRIENLVARGVVRQLGYVPEEDLPALYSGATTFFMPSLYEGFGMPVLEAYSCSTPVVASDIPPLREACCNVGMFHEPSYEGISSALDQIFRGGSSPPLPDPTLVDWSWESGAMQLSQVIDEAAVVR